MTQRSHLYKEEIVPSEQNRLPHEVLRSLPFAFLQSRRVDTPNKRDWLRAEKPKDTDTTTNRRRRTRALRSDATSDRNHENKNRQDETDQTDLEVVSVIHEARAQGGDDPPLRVGVEVFDKVRHTQHSVSESDVIVPTLEIVAQAPAKSALENLIFRFDKHKSSAASGQAMLKPPECQQVIV